MYTHRHPRGVLKCITICLIALYGLLSCGLETLYYIDYIDPSDYINETRATVRLPSSSREGYGGANDYFDHFIIFYRIYLSNANIGSGAFYPTQLNLVNSSLGIDYGALSSLTDTTSTSVTTSNLDNTFYNRYYCKLELEGESIDNILGKNSLGQFLEISFYDVQGRVPRLILKNTPDPSDPTDPDVTFYVLQRARDVGNRYPFSPLPDNSRSFLNYPDLYNVANAKTEINADASPHSGANVEFTYVSMYIAAQGRSGETPPTTIFSQPTFIGIFKLPNQ
jgi:hypothetical protein